jgi:transposase
MSWKRGQSYSQDLRDRVLAAEGVIRAVADRFGVSASFVSKATSRLRLTGQRTAKRRGGQQPAIMAGREDILRGRVAEVPDATLEELRAWLLAEHGIKISIGALWGTLDRLDLRCKKNPARRRAGSCRGDGTAARMERGAADA